MKDICLTHVFKGLLVGVYWRQEEAWVGYVAHWLHRQTISLPYSQFRPGWGKRSAHCASQFWWETLLHNTHPRDGGCLIFSEHYSSSYRNTSISHSQENIIGPRSAGISVRRMQIQCTSRFVFSIYHCNNKSLEQVGSNDLLWANLCLCLPPVPACGVQMQMLWVRFPSTLWIHKCSLREISCMCSHFVFQFLHFHEITSQTPSFLF